MESCTYTCPSNPSFKIQWGNQKSNLEHESQRKDACLSKHIWDLKDNGCYICPYNHTNELYMYFYKYTQKSNLILFLFTAVIRCQYSLCFWPFLTNFLLFLIQDFLHIYFFWVAKSFDQCIRHFPSWFCSVYFYIAYSYLIKASQNYCIPLSHYF